jgi:hypothetical protein
MVLLIGTSTRALTSFLHRCGILHAAFSVAYEHDTQWIGIGKREYYKPSLRLSSPLPPNITLLGDRKLDTLALRQRDPRLWALTDDKNVGYPGYA